MPMHGGKPSQCRLIEIFEILTEFAQVKGLLKGKKFQFFENFRKDSE